MIKEIRMPAAGQTTDVAVIGKWCVKLGDVVKRGDVLLEAETDKAVLPVESFAAGTVLKINFEEGDEVNAGDVLALVGDPGDINTEATIEPDKSMAAEPSVVSAMPQVEQDEYIAIIPETETPASMKQEAHTRPECASALPAMPNAKKLAKEASVTLSSVVPENGIFITVHDVQKKMNAAPAAMMEATSEETPYQVIAVSRMRTIIGNHMLESVRNIPVFTASIQVDMREAIQQRDYCREHYDLNVSFNDMMVKALAVVAKSMPLLNSRMESGELRVYAHTNVGIAVSMDGGLLVPVVKCADRLTLREIAETNRTNISNARNGKVLPTDMGCGSTTISNLGMFGVTQFEAIVNPPETSIFAVGKISESPVWNGSTFEPIPMMSITGSFDHRVFDGSDGARVLQLLQEHMEHPALLAL